MTKNQLIALKNEIKSDPTEIGYAGKSREEIYNLITIENISVRVNVPWFDLFNYLMINGLWFGISAASKNPDHPAYLMAIAAMELKDIYKNELIDTGCEAFVATADAFIAAGFITESHKEYIVGMGDRVVSRAYKLGFLTISPSAIDWAMEDR